uniref:Gustatory receptor n=1 Tax=Anopheles darlingi TaxID=43151 RepID=A0A2K6VAZ1_ANODA
MLLESRPEFSSRDDFLKRFRRALWIQHAFGVSSVFIDTTGKCSVRKTGPVIIVGIFIALYLLIAWLVVAQNEVLSLTCYKFNIFSTFWRPSQTSLAQCWQMLVDKIIHFPVLYNRTVSTTLAFRIFWSWVIALSIMFSFILPTLVIRSRVKLMQDINHYMLFFMRMFGYLAQTTICASFGLFAMLVRSVIRELQAFLHDGAVSTHQMRSIIQLYRHVCQMIDCFCAVYGWVLLLMFFEHFIIITDRSFFAIRMYRVSAEITFTQIVRMMSTWIMPLFINDFLLSGSCTAAEAALHEFEKHLCNYGKLYEDNEEVAFLVTSFTFYVAEPKPRFRILNALNLNIALLYAVLIATYLTVFLQFDPVQ